MKKNVIDALIAFAISSMSLLTILGLARFLPYFRVPANVVMLFLLSVLFCAVWRGLVASLITAVLTFLFYNFFFTEPYHTLMVKHWYDITTLVVFLFVALTTGSLAGRVKEQAYSASFRIKALQSLYDLSRCLGGAKSKNDVLQSLGKELYNFTKNLIVIILSKEKSTEIVFSNTTQDFNITNEYKGAVDWTLQNGYPSGSLTNIYSNLEWHFRPIKIKDNEFGVLGIKQNKKEISPEYFLIVDTMLDQASVALERIEFEKAISHAEAVAETERFRNALLSSISHDLRTPLTSILGSVTALNSEPSYPLVAQKELISTIREEAERLNRFVANLLDITRLESGSVKVNKEWLVVSEIIEATVRRIKNYAPSKKIIIQTEENLPLIKADFVMLDTVLFNLLDNSIKYSGEGAEITVKVSKNQDKIEISVLDNGVGISPEFLPFLFDKFYRAKKADHTIAGTGLGLSICKGLVYAMGGEIKVISPYIKDKGVCFSLLFPLENPPEMVSMEEI